MGEGSQDPSEEAIWVGVVVVEGTVAHRDGPSQDYYSHRLAYAGTHWVNWATIVNREKSHTEGAPDTSLRVKECNRVGSPKPDIPCFS